MAGENTVTTASGLYKTVYGDEFTQPKHDFAVLQKRVKFSPAEKGTGNYFEQPIALSYENGFTYNGTSGTVVQLKAPKNAIVKPAQIYGSELLLRSQMSDTYISRAIEKGKKAFENATRFTLQEMDLSMRKRVEIAMLYGQSGLGTIESVTDLGSSTMALVLTEGTWAGGIWAGAEGVTLDSYTGTTKNNDLGVLTITKVDSDARKLTVSHSGTYSTQAAVGDVLYFESAAVDGQATFNEMAGLQKIISNSGSLFGIDAATYSLWRGTSVSSVGALDFSKLQTYVARAVNKGLMEKCLVLVSPKGWSAFANDMGALRMLDSSYSSKKATNGAEGLEFYSQNGALEVVAHPLVKDGDCFILPEKAIERIGSADVTFGLPGGSDRFFTWVPDYNAVELRCRTDQALFLSRPAHAVFLTGITY